MVNAVEFDSLLKEVEYLKHENQKLKEQLKDAQGRIRVLKEEVGFAERGYTKVNNLWSAIPARKKPRLKRQGSYPRTLDGPSVAESVRTVASRCGLSRCPQKMLLWRRRNESNV
jgi:hypothetical protein